ncbi:MAG: hypothetical protein ACE3L7_10120 [Candidatus Pristimantibacillus sp.]|uniref:hypothetical protein n=1 Tax=Paenibacillus sp. FSL H7-0331 TaxID=1920421 RepID=UPI0015C2DEC3|nr:hypothetical protein [Paenibacillus sp. FSL H7-0331]
MQHHTGDTSADDRMACDGEAVSIAIGAGLGNLGKHIGSHDPSGVELRIHDLSIP